MAGERARYWAEGEGLRVGYGPIKAHFRYALDARRLTLHASAGGRWFPETTMIETRAIAHFRPARHGKGTGLEFVLTAAPKHLKYFAGHGLVRPERGLTVLTLPLDPAGAATLARGLREVGVADEETAGEGARARQFRDDVRHLLRAAAGTYELRPEDRDAFVAGLWLVPVGVVLALIARPPAVEPLIMFASFIALIWLYALVLALVGARHATIDETGIVLKRRIRRLDRRIAAGEITAFSVVPYRHDELLTIETARGKTRVRLSPPMRAALGRADAAVLGRLGLNPTWPAFPDIRP